MHGSYGCFWKEMKYPPWNQQQKHLKMDGWKMIHFVWVSAHFQGRTVALREGTHLWRYFAEAFFFGLGLGINYIPQTTRMLKLEITTFFDLLQHLHNFGFQRWIFIAFIQSRPSLTYMTWSASCGMIDNDPPLVNSYRIYLLYDYTDFEA